MIDRTEVNRALAKAVAYKNCGKHAQAEAWAWKLIRLLECGDILRDTTDAMASEMAMIRVGH